MIFLLHSPYSHSYWTKKVDKEFAYIGWTKLQSDKLKTSVFSNSALEMCANDWPSLEDAISASKWPTLENCAFEMIAFLSRYHFAKCWCSDGYQTFPTLQPSV